MKKLYFLALTLFASAFGFAQSVVITTVVDGTLPSDGCSGTTGSSNPKIVELYISGTVDFTGYSIETESNGGAPLSWAAASLSALGTKTNTFVYLVSAGQTTFNEMYPSITIDLSTNMPNGNGNDAYRITDGTTVIDQFGDPSQITGSSDYSAPWAYQDSYAKRNNGVPANGGTFVSSSFTYGGNAAFVAPNNTCAFMIDAIDLGQFALSAPSFDAIAGLKVYPNPVTNGKLFISSNANADRTVAIFDVLGKQVLNTTATEYVNVSNLKGGVYIVKITEEGKTATRKLVIK